MYDLQLEYKVWAHQIPRTFMTRISNTIELWKQLASHRHLQMSKSSFKDRISNSTNPRGWDQTQNCKANWGGHGLCQGKAYPGSTLF